MPQLSGPITQTMAQYSVGGSAGRAKKIKNVQKETTPGPALSGGGRQENKQTKKRTSQASQPNHTRDAPDPDIKNPETHYVTQGENSDPKTPKAPGTTQGENSNPKTQKLREIIQGGEPRKPGKCRARRRRESQLITAAPLESSTLRWTSRENVPAT